MQSTLSFPKGVLLDLNKLALTGHSFGGGTVVGATAKDSRIKAAMGQDSWFLPYMLDLKSVMLSNTPFLHVRASNYFTGESSPGYDCETVSTKYFTALAKTGNTKVDRVMLKDTTHMTFTDYSVLLVMELSGFWPDSESTAVKKSRFAPWL